MIQYNLHHVNGLYFELIDYENKEREYDCSFVDNENNKVIYTTKLRSGGWAKLNRKYLSDISIIVKYKQRIVKEISVIKSLSVSLRNNRVFISFESSSLGDTLAWLPYCDEFQKKYDCKLFVSTFHNYLFQGEYPNIEFVGRGVTIHNLKAMFEIGWFYDTDKEPVRPNLIPLQQAATNILMLPYREIPPNLAFVPKERPTMSKYVCISTQSTSKCKHWDYWQEVINYLKSNDYIVYEMSKEPSNLDGLDIVLDKDLPNTMNYLYHCDFFIGLSSGISWLAWGLRKKVIMISNFSLKSHEFQTDCIRIDDESVCHGCWNNPMFRFDKGNWYWCPEHEDTDRAFECHKLMSAKKVIDAIQPFTR